MIDDPTNSLKFPGKMCQNGNGRDGSELDKMADSSNMGLSYNSKLKIPLMKFKVTILIVIT